MLLIPRRAYHHGNLRPTLIKATLRAIAEDGPDGFTLRDVARRAGVSAAAPYRHFTDKDELLAAVAGECAERLGATIEEAVASDPGADALAQFRLIGIAYIQFAAAHPEHFRALHMPGMASRMPAAQRAAMEEINARQARMILDGQAAGVIAPIPVIDLVTAATALVTGVGHMIVEGFFGEVPPGRAKELAIMATGVLGEGLIPRAGCHPGDPLKQR